MESRWEIWLDDALGNRIALLDQARAWDLTRIENAIGRHQLALPGNFDKSLLWDGMLEYWRAPAGGPMQWAGLGLIDTIQKTKDENGLRSILVAGPDGIDLLDRRIVAYAAASAQAEKTDQADDMLKAIVRENLGASCTDTARDLSGYGLSVPVDVGKGPSLTKAFAWQNVLKAIQDICEASRTAGTRLYFDMVPIQVSEYRVAWEFRTYTGQRGLDRTQGGLNPVFVGDAWGNVASESFTRSRQGERNYAYVGGQSEEADREIVQQYDAAAIAASPWNRREVFVNASNADSTGALTAAGQAELGKRRAYRRYSATLQETPTFRYGLEWGFGDRLAVEADGEQFDAEIRAVKFTVGESGQERIEARIEVDP